jgi:hypothetical protein
MQNGARPRLNGPGDHGTCKAHPRPGHLEDQRRAPFVSFDRTPAGGGLALVAHPCPRISAVAEDLWKCFAFRFDHSFVGGPRRDHLMQIPVRRCLRSASMAASCWRQAAVAGTDSFCDLPKAQDLSAQSGQARNSVAVC